MTTTSRDDETIRHDRKLRQKQRIWYAEICKTIKKKARVDFSKYIQEIIRETIMARKTMWKVRRTQKLGKDKPTTLLDKQGREILS